MIGAFLLNFLEFLAFIMGLFYYRKNKSKPTYYFVLFLGITIFSEIIRWYVVLIDNGLLFFLKGTVFESNYWLGNIYAILSYLFYINYFKWFLISKRFITILNISSILFFIWSLLEIFFSGDFFVGFMPVTNIIGTLFVFLGIAFYYLELLKSDRILQMNKSLPFYVSVGALIFHLCTTPLFLYSSYYSNSIDPGFVILYRQVIFGTNYLLYSIYIAGFLICLRKKNPYFLRKNF